MKECGVVQEKPARVLAYKASAVHQYGWIPLNPFKWRNVKATVFSSVLLNVQTVVLVGWALIIHTTGLGMHDYDIRAFLKIWGTVYAGVVALLGCYNCRLPTHFEILTPVEPKSVCRGGVQSRDCGGLYSRSLHIPRYQPLVVHPNCLCASPTTHSSRLF